MKIHAAAFLLVGAIATPVCAADLYHGGLKDAAPVVAPVPVWTGFYLGGNVGGGWASLNFNDHELANDSGFVGGGQIGYNYQVGALVLGIESDIGVVSMSDLNDGNSSMLIDVTGRLGFAAGPALFYAKGGWAYLDVANGLDGWTVGGGIEYKFSQNWSVKAEYQHFDFADLNGVSGLDLTANVGKVGINYHFANSYVPLK